MIFAFDFSNKKILLRAAGLLAVVVIFACLALIEYIGKPNPRTRKIVWRIIGICVLSLAIVVVSLKGS